MKKFDELAQQFNTEDIIAAILSMQYLGRVELQNEYIVAAELFASNIIRYDNIGHPLTLSGHRKLARLAKSVLRNDSVVSIIKQAIALRASKATNEQKEEFIQSMQMKTKNMIFRGEGYAHQLVEIAEKLYKPFDIELHDKFGFSFSCTEAVIIYIIQTYIQRSQMVISKTTPMDAIKYLWCRLLHKPAYIYAAARITDEFRIYKSELYSRYPKLEIDNMIRELSIAPGTIQYGEIGIEDFKPLYSKPFIDFGDYIYLPLPVSTLLNLPKLFHYYFVADDLFSKDIKGRYNNHRGNIIEELTEEYLIRLFNPNNIYRSLKYPEKSKTFEADLTAVDTEVSVFAECKAKILVTASLNGCITNLKDDVYKAIGKAYEQAVRTIKHVHSGKAFFDPATNSKVTLPCTSTNYILCVNIEHFGSIPTEIKKYIKIDPDVAIIPIAINLYDLDIITAECADMNEFTEYLEFRIANIDLLVSFDELDSFMYYKKHGKGKILLGPNAILMPCNLTTELDYKYQSLATSIILSKTTHYPAI